MITAAAGDSLDDEDDGSTAFWKIMLMWTAACIMVGMIAGAALWSRCCANKTRASLTRSIQTEEIEEPPAAARRTIIVQKPETVFSTTHGEKMHLSLDCRHVRGRTAKVHDVCRDCLR